MSQCKRAALVTGNSNLTTLSSVIKTYDYNVQEGKSDEHSYRVTSQKVRETF